MDVVTNAPLRWRTKGRRHMRKTLTAMRTEWNTARPLRERLATQLAHGRGADGPGLTAWQHDVSQLARLTGQTEEAVLTMLHEDAALIEE